METQKSLKQYAREAKQRLKSGFWQRYHENLRIELEKAKEAGYSESKIKEYYVEHISDTIKNTKEEDEQFYKKVKKLLDEEGEISNAIGRLTDTEVYDKLSYEEKQAYTLRLSEQYVKARERYEREKIISY